MCTNGTTRISTTQHKWEKFIYGGETMTEYKTIENMCKEERTALARLLESHLTFAQRIDYTPRDNKVGINYSPKERIGVFYG